MQNRKGVDNNAYSTAIFRLKNRELPDLPNSHPSAEEDEQNNYILPDGEQDGEFIHVKNNKTLLQPEPIEVTEFQKFMNRNKDDVIKDIYQQFMVCVKMHFKDCL